jgi:Uma2 family endonuclease
MTADAAYRKITVEEFLDMDFGRDKRVELVDGAIYAMTGGTVAHARVQSNILIYLGGVLRESGCRPFGPDMALQTNAFTTRYPDVTVYRDEPGAARRDRDLLIENPRIIFEVLSPSSRSNDEDRKLKEYQALPSVDTIVLVDPEAERVRVIQRLGADAWRSDLFGAAADVPLPSIGVTIPAAELFARD